MYKCAECGRDSSEISEYQSMAIVNGCTPDEAVESQEGTFNKRDGIFYCTRCYIKIGMPLGVARQHK